MTANLFGERFASRREPAWHRLGEVFKADEKLLLLKVWLKQMYYLRYRNIHRL